MACYIPLPLDELVGCKAYLFQKALTYKTIKMLFQLIGGWEINCIVSQKQLVLGSMHEVEILIVEVTTI